MKRKQGLRLRASINGYDIKKNTGFNLEISIWNLHSFKIDKMKKLISILLICLTANLIFAQLETEIADLFEEKENCPGGIIGVFEDGKIEFQKAYGLANLDYYIPITSKTVFDVGSIGKQFTAACIFLLEQQGKLSIDDPIQKFLPEMPVFQEEVVNIRNLLNHTSGFRDYVEITAYAGIPFENIFTEEMGLDIMTRQKERSFPPGQQHMYNNGGYLLLAIIIRRVAGESIGTFAQKHIFEPLGMQSTFILENPNRIVKNSATGYTPLTDSTYQKKHFYNIALGGDGQVYTTFEDLLLWDNNFYDHQVGGQALYDRQHERGILNNGDTIEYAGGLFIQENNGQRVVQHTGSWGGFRAVLWRLPSLKKTLVVLANTPDFLNGPKFFGLLDLMIPKEEAKQKTKEIERPTNTPKLTTQQLQKHTGLFAVKDQPHLRLQNKLKNDTLTITQLWDEQEYQLIPSSENEFFRKDRPMVKCTFDKQTGAPVIVNEIFEVWQTERVDAYHSRANLEEYIGEYHSVEVGVTYAIQVEAKQLVVLRNNEKIKNLLPVSEDVFGNQIQGYQFIREEGKINSFMIQDRRIRNLQFSKMNN